VPGEAFRQLGRLEQLWLPYNAVSELSALMLRGLRRLRELRLPGNRLAAFPWAALRDAPQLRLLDLQANRLSVVPPDAARFLGNLTFLDLSSNQLMRLPQELLLTWAQLKTGPFLPGHHSRLVLGKRRCSSPGTILVNLGVFSKFPSFFESDSLSGK
jgi:Leucine-rich repeat (LRR) protein